jgi:signal transduction histidine kinase
MRVTRHKRQILLFLSAILVPVGVLVGLSGRLLYQDRELSLKRAGDRHRAAVEQLRRELVARLDAVRLQEINRQIRSTHSDAAPYSDNPAVVFTAVLGGDSLVMPWEVSSPEYSPEFARRLQEGETLELAKKDYRAAATQYGSALTAARTPAETADARLHLARTLGLSGNSIEANRVYQELLHDSAGARDAEGVGYRFYAAERLLNAGADIGAVKEFLREEAKSENRLTLPELYMIRSLLGPDPTISSRIEEMEQSVALARDIGRIRARIEAGADWVPYGQEPWLVTITARQPGLPQLVLAVSSSKVTPPGLKLRAHVANGEGQDDSLGDAFPGLHVEWPGNQFQETSRGLPAGIWIAGLVLVLGMAVFGGYLLLRDVNRDVRMTEVRSQFVASVSHELKTPLTAIRMFAETLAMGRSRDETTRAEYLETIVNESERLARLVDNVLDFSKIEQGKKIYRPRPARLEDVAGSAVRAMQFPLAQQGFRLHFSVEEEVPELQVDPDAIQQAILNLLTNAMKYSGEAREIDLTIAARNGDAVIKVKDRGLGLAPDEQKHIFEKFYRAPSHASQLIAGTGLGLTLVAHIAKAHHGRVEVESAPGAGSTFSIVLPIEARA